MWWDLNVVIVGLIILAGLKVLWILEVSIGIVSMETEDFYLTLIFYIDLDIAVAAAPQEALGEASNAGNNNDHPQAEQPDLGNNSSTSK